VPGVVVVGAVAVGAVVVGMAPVGAVVVTAPAGTVVVGADVAGEVVEVPGAWGVGAADCPTTAPTDVLAPGGRVPAFCRYVRLVR
jgi:hypothetical protein